MKQLLLIIFFSLWINKVYAASLVVCENIRKNGDINVLAIDEGKKIINWDNRIIYNITEGEGFGTGKGGSPKLGDIWGMDKTGTKFFAINRFTYKAFYRNAASSAVRYYECRKADKNNILF